VRGARVSLPEEENITLRVKVFDNPLGTNIGNVREELDDVEEHVSSGWWGIIKYPRIIFDYAEMMCSVISVLVQLLGVWTAITEGIGAACTAYQVLCSASSSMNRETGVQDTAIQGFLGDFSLACGLIISCRATQPSALGEDTVEPEMKDGQPTGEYKCKDDDSTWCTIMLGWSKVNSWWADTVMGVGKLSPGGPPPQATDASGSRIGGREWNESKATLTRTDVMNSFDPKRSLISSIMTVCLPGIFKGIEKYRQIYCKWLMCYKIDIAYGSMMMSQCDELLRYDWCVYVLGDVFNAIPWFQYGNDMVRMVRDVITDPFLLAGYAVDIACNQLCSTGDLGPACGICTAVAIVNTLTQIAASIAGMAEGSYWTAPMDDICEEAVKDEPKYSNIPGYPREADPEQQTPPEEDTGAAA
jgi:hypothetical protein